MEKIEYRVRPVTRYVVTRWESKDIGAKCQQASSVIGEYDNADMAYEVAYAVCKTEHSRLGWPPGDERVKYPERAQNEPITLCGDMSVSGTLQSGLAAK